MTKIGDFLAPDDQKALTRHSINIGDVFLIPMTKEEGITPKGYDEFRNKFFVVLGFDEEGYAYGGVIINSRINRNIPINIQELHMPIRCADYKFLTHNSFVDCSQLHIVRLEKLKIELYKGNMTEEHIRLIIGTVTESKTISKKTLQRFHLS